MIILLSPVKLKHLRKGRSEFFQFSNPKTFYLWNQFCVRGLMILLIEADDTQVWWSTTCSIAQNSKCSKLGIATGKTHVCIHASGKSYNWVIVSCTAIRALQRFDYEHKIRCLFLFMPSKDSIRYFSSLINYRYTEIELITAARSPLAVQSGTEIIGIIFGKVWLY